MLDSSPGATGPVDFSVSLPEPCESPLFVIRTCPNGLSLFVDRLIRTSNACILLSAMSPSQDLRFRSTRHWRVCKVRPADPLLSVALEAIHPSSS
eukprot:scaffold1299_cov385-Pavlova_lutheri.AAC.3